ncbi:YktB family protein [Paenibacillus sp. GCM10028914]|uniref:YktB family protein n=1 Tax=Paenibacillus sp. GCM10028914 TaxID=3273416 RepID=UPI00361C8E15
MSFTGFTADDFDVFTVPGLEGRMEVLIERVRPKLETLGAEIAPYISALCGEEMFVHVAKHARRTVNPPIDTWVAWAANKRGYKALPHFEVGMFESHLFIIFAIIYESPNKTTFARNLEKEISEIQLSLPKAYYWSTDHMSPGGTPHEDMDQERFDILINKLKQVKKAEVMCGLRIPREEAAKLSGDELVEKIQETFETLLPLYRMAF